MGGVFSVFRGYVGYEGVIMYLLLWKLGLVRFLLSWGLGITSFYFLALCIFRCALLLLVKVGRYSGRCQIGSGELY